MTDLQLYLAIGVPSFVALAGIFVNGLLYLWLNARMTSLEAHMDARFTDLKDTWRAELRRVEEVLDARLKHLEERQ